MPPSDGHCAEGDPANRFDGTGRNGNVETMLFEALVHQLIEKGLLTKNDALSVVQTVAEIHRSRDEVEAHEGHIGAEIAFLRRLYGSFEMMRGSPTTASSDQGNVLQLRPPLHGNVPEFPHK